AFLKKKERFFWILIILLILAMGYCARHVSREENVAEQDKYMRLFHEAYTKLRTHYALADKVKSSKKLVYGAIKGMFAATGDPYTSFMDERFFSMLKEQMGGQFGGIGFSLMKRDKQYVILYTMPGSPARRGGILPRDRLIKINGKPTKKMKYRDVLKHLKGPVKTKVNLTLSRGKSKKVFTVTIIRAIIKTPDVEYKMLKNKIAYLKLKQFSHVAAGPMEAVLSKFKKNNIKGLIFDLRGNTGGSLETCSAITNFFLEGNRKLVYIKGHIEQPGHYLKSHGSRTIFPTLPLVVLSDGMSASASEIFIGAMQDHRRAVVFGSKSFGKGSVQVFNRSDTGLNVGFKATNSMWYTPKRRAIHKVGLDPDIEITRTKLSQTERYYLYRLNKMKLIEKYVEAHPKLSRKDITRFNKRLKKKKINLNKDLVTYLLKYEKYLFKGGLIIDMNHDKVLSAAWNYLNHRTQ
ncbi:MAG: S41 family peptidase, partial [Spirochaetota bacterium]|nr:S41 family peptidase [Spirochaetota bacterium]